MKKALRIIALVLTIVMMGTTLCGCSTLVDAFVEGYNAGMQEANGSNSSDDILLIYDDDYIIYGLFNLRDSGDELGFAYGWTLERID